jgi:NAD(P)-dependent dehydrogenase (short-subunit alcohol dehydrogenase family)
VTGGGSGIGLVTARELASLGAKVAICGRKQEKIDAALEALVADGAPREQLYGACCDIREPDAVSAFVGAVLERFAKKVDVLVNNAGGQFPSPPPRCPPGLGGGHPQQPERHLLHDARGGDPRHDPRQARSHRE